MRYMLVVALLLMGVCSEVLGESWAAKLIPVAEHDFGRTPQGAVREHRFKIKNPFHHEVRIAGVDTSCGCLTAEAKSQSLGFEEEGEILVRWRAKEFAGEQSPIATVKFDKPFPADLQLTLHGIVSPEIALEPGAVEFGTVKRGADVSREVRLTCRRTRNWKICEIVGKNPNLQAEFAEIARSDLQVTYCVRVLLNSVAPQGYLHDSLILKSEPPDESPFEIDVRGRLTDTLSVAPALVSFGVMKAGEQRTRQIVLRADRPFKLLRVEAANAGLTFEYDSETAKTLHVVPVTYTTGELPSALFESITVSTDLPGNDVAEVPVHAMAAE